MSIRRVLYLTLNYLLTSLIVGNPRTLFHDIILANDDIIAEQSISIEKMEGITEKLLRKRSRSKKKDFIVWKSKEITPQ